MLTANRVPKRGRWRHRFSNRAQNGSRPPIHMRRPQEQIRRKIPGFTYPDFRAQQMVPSIVENCDLSTDGKTAVYHLRKGVKSAVGNEFTAKDVLWRVDRANELKAIGTFLQNAVNAPDPKQWQEVDDHTVRISSDKPMPLICKILTNLYWWYDSTEAKKHSTPDDPWATKWASTSLVAFGPYVIRSWEAGNRVVMDANPNYWQGPPKIKHIIYQVVPESASRVALLKEGKVDLIEGVSPDEAVSLAAASNVRVAAVHGNQSIYLVMNNIKAPFDKVQVRQAINHLLAREQDRQRYLSRAGRHLGRRNAQRLSGLCGIQQLHI